MINMLLSLITKLIVHKHRFIREMVLMIFFLMHVQLKIPYTYFIVAFLSFGGFLLFLYYCDDSNEISLKKYKF